MEEKQAQLIHLDQPRVISFRDRGVVFSYHFRRVTDGDYRNIYFPGLGFSSEVSNGAVTTRQDLRSPSHALLDAALIKVEGYRMREGELTALPNWKEKLPYGHKDKVADMLLKVNASESDPTEPYYFDPDCQEVRVDALWGSEAGKTELFKGLAHRFTPPSSEQQRKFHRASGESRIVGGTRKARTIHAGKHGILADMYDELVISVEGYAVGGSPLTSPQQIAKEMDTWHKVSAITVLFAEPEDEPQEAAA